MRRDCRTTRGLGPYTTAIDWRIMAIYQVVRFAIFKILRLCARIEIRGYARLQRGQFVNVHGFDDDRKRGRNPRTKPRFRNELPEKMQSESDESRTYIAPDGLSL